MNSHYDSYYNSYYQCVPRIPLQPYRWQTTTADTCGTMYERYSKDTTERYQKDTTEKYQKDTTEGGKRLPSLLKNALLHGKQTAKPNYYHADSETNINMILSSQQTVPSSHTVSHNLYQVPPPEYHTSPSEISPTEYEQFFGNLQRQQQQDCHELSQNYQEYVQSHNYDFSGPSTISMQYEQNKSKQQTIFNAQESQIGSYRNNNNNTRQRNKNIEPSNYNNEQRGPCSSNIVDYPWMYKRTSGKSLIITIIIR